MLSWGRPTAMLVFICMHIYNYIYRAPWECGSINWTSSLFTLTCEIRQIILYWFTLAGLVLSTTAVSSTVRLGLTRGEKYIIPAPTLPPSPPQIRNRHTLQRVRAVRASPHGALLPPKDFVTVFDVPPVGIHIPSSGGVCVVKTYK